MVLSIGELHPKKYNDTHCDTEKVLAIPSIAIKYRNIKC
jgi:hypothetical protein